MRVKEANERKTNEMEARRLHGTPVRFGQTIQLEHVNSGQFVKILPRDRADFERENVKVMLDSEPDEGAWLQVRCGNIDS